MIVSRGFSGGFGLLGKPVKKSNGEDQGNKNYNALSAVLLVQIASVGNDSGLGSFLWFTSVLETHDTSHDLFETLMTRWQVRKESPQQAKELSHFFSLCHK